MLTALIDMVSDADKGNQLSSYRNLNSKSCSCLNNLNSYN